MMCSVSIICLYVRNVWIRYNALAAVDGVSAKRCQRSMGLSMSQASIPVEGLYFSG